MKRNTLLRASALLLVATLTTSCFVGGTFAKYTTNGTAEDTARVAKWGVEVNLTALDQLFLNQYGKHDINSNVDESTVVTQGKLDVFAPGTERKISGLSVTGTPEVDCKVITDAEVTIENWDVNGEFYCPLIFTIEGVPTTGGKTETKTIRGLDYTGNGDATSLKSELESAIEKAYTGEFEAGTKLDEQFTSKSIAWEWPYQGTSPQNTAPGHTTTDWTEQADQIDEKDTELGNKAAENEDNAPKITVKLTTTVTQID